MEDHGQEIREIWQESIADQEAQMRISFVDRFSRGNRGISNFLALLRTEFNNRSDVSVVGESQRSDVHLGIINSLKQGCMNVLRLDGVYYDRNRIDRGYNRSIVSSMRKANGIIFQSKWSENFVIRMLKVKQPHHSTVIWNGSDRRLLEEAKKTKPTSDFDKVFVCCAHWRPNKRLQAIVDSLLLARQMTGQNLGLRIIGACPGVSTEHKAVKALGTLSHQETLTEIAHADCMIHICHLDSCPNVVVEALLSGIPVVCNNIGGTPELVQGDGVVAGLDKRFDFQAITDMNVVDSRSVDKAILANAISEAASRTWNIHRPELDIKKVADQYLKFFRRLLRR
jgi:glycosyltransferase involved in cell wall biosynthesis